MLCQNCGKNEANVRYTEVINGEKTEMILCEKCSKELGIDKIDFNMPIDFSSFFGGILGEYESCDFLPMVKKTETAKCDFCNMTYDEFVKNGKFGCANCYNVFSDKIAPILTRVHGNNKYLGRKLGTSNIEETNQKEIKNGPSNEILKLQEELKQAIKEERYEDAAKIRDKIKKRGE